MDEEALLKATKILWESVCESAGSTLSWEDAPPELQALAIEHARRTILTYLDAVQS